MSRNIKNSKSVKPVASFIKIIKVAGNSNHRTAEISNFIFFYIINILSKKTLLNYRSHFDFIFQRITMVFQIHLNSINNTCIN